MRPFWPLRGGAAEYPAPEAGPRRGGGRSRRGERRQRRRSGGPGRPGDLPARVRLLLEELVHSPVRGSACPPGHVRPHDIPGEDSSTQYRPIDADVVRSALWLTRAARRDSAREPIRIEPITMRRPLGYVTYFVEKLPNDTEGYQQARKFFERDLAGRSPG